MFDMILNVLTYIVIFFQVAGIIFGVIAFFLAATWMQVNEERKAANEQKA